MKVLVTGATGFLGQYIVRELVAHNYQIVAFGRKEAVGKKLEEDYPSLTFVRGDLRSSSDLEKAIKDCSGVVHAGALSDLWGRWQDFYDTNVLGTQHILELCQKYRCQRLVHISSPSIYARPHDQLNLTEEQAPQQNKLNYYIKSKLLAEQLVLKAKGVPSVILRPRGLFGIGDSSIVPRLLRVNDSLGIPLLHQGKQLIDMTCVENAAYAVRLCLEKEAALGQIYNVTNGEPMPFKTLLELFFKEAGKTAQFRPYNAKFLGVLVTLLEFSYRLCRSPKEPPLTRYTYYLLAYSQTLSIDKIRRELGYSPQLSLLEGVQNYVKHHPIS
ncbi:NAD(P)-dependent oxidoreductase [Streptococcus chenjunshii]|uniref:NAD(P)-dependent oxidoreductase n=1 Tax=Streptococcus chenjunshii TaxID=2173853 RepID=A0A372KKZ5_9STRE|nr:NAD(P)-dependent oxidoreductase [Streptococcus chenjunshii]AXQ79194.1 NAD(P)-dependent oxidoreductase [Streptococcus chenjunshii]RFU50766.1 NAD(P)-dependent oxidoreductase [Streptococcus chenjunshii]RFU52947.1 NAD(P)-dependent oxidoreductase [Streptococcus chenjunshii]